MIKSIIRFGLLMIVLASFTLPTAKVAAAATTLSIGDVIGDQYFWFGGASGWEVNYLWNTTQMARVGQEFTPTLAALNIVYLVPFTCDGCSPQWLQLNIRKNSIFGKVVGTSDPVQLDAAKNETYYRFLFSSLVHLKPGDRYVIEVVPVTGTENSILWYGEPGVDFYTGGNAIKLNQPVSNADIWFDERVIISVPTSALDCHSNGWKYLLRPDNSAFQNQGECIRYANNLK